MNWKDKIIDLIRNSKGTILISLILVDLFAILALSCYLIFGHNDNRQQTETKNDGIVNDGQIQVEEYSLEVFRHETELAYYSHKDKLVVAVQEYIESIAPASSLTGYAIVENCEKYDLDIKFVLAQGQIESRFGTCGMASKTNSVFNVGAYDNTKYEKINGKFKYKHPDYSIEPYMQLLYRDYITETKTELDLMAKYVNKSGQRYATNPNYETEMMRTYQYIDTNTNITELQGELKRYKVILGK